VGRLPNKVKRDENGWYGKYDPCYIPIVVPARVLRKPKKNVDVLVRSPSGKAGFHPNARLEMFLVEPAYDVIVGQGSDVSGPTDMATAWGLLVNNGANRDMC
jgi:hypothetical protein